jgi:PTH1 family peptidyl-tRNA hydrolase
MKIFRRISAEPKDESMNYLIAGLGNPGEDYVHTRHNAGFLVMDRMADKYEVEWALKRHAHYTEMRFRGKQLVLIKPTTFMNLSGKAIRYWMRQEKIPLKNILIVVDDIHIPFRSIRIKGKGSDAGHNGLKDIQQQLGTSNYTRLRFGIGSDFGKGAQVNFVLGKWSKEEEKFLAKICDMSVNAIESFIHRGLQMTMSEFNRKVIE